MKRVLIIALVLMLAGSVAAQDFPTDQGVWTLGGSVSYTSQSGDLWEVGGDPITVLQFMPEIGYFVSPNIMVGAVVDISRLSVGNNELNESGFGPIIGYYFPSSNLETKGSFIPHIKALFVFQSVGDQDDSDSYTSFGGSIGADYMITNSVSLNFGILFMADSWKPDGAPKSITGSSFSFGIGVGTFIY